LRTLLPLLGNLHLVFLLLGSHHELCSDCDQGNNIKVFAANDVGNIVCSYFIG